MKYSSIPSAQSIVFHCKERGVKNIVISPGSRNAPLTLGFSEDSFFECFSIVDERCAAFFALGIAQQIRKPVALVCTSGSALLNYYPAIAEAYYSDIPLIILSADRPPHKIDIGDGQTIRQDNVFERHIGYSANLKLDIWYDGPNRVLPQLKDEDTLNLENEQITVQAHNDEQINKALRTAFEDKTPVHINLPFEEPLYNALEKSTVVPFIVSYEAPFDEPIKDLDVFAAQWNKAKRKMVLVGVLPPNSVEQQFLDELAEDESVIVFTETTSNIHHPNFFAQIDGILAPIEKVENKKELFQALQPDLLITFGGLIVSKKIKAFLRTYAPKTHWHIDSKKGYDTFFCLTKHFKTDINYFFNHFLQLTTPLSSSYRSYWDIINKQRKKLRKEYLDIVAFSDLYVFHKIIQHIPVKYQLQLANSSTVRYAQLFDIHSSISVFCNRGTSGIDGSTSTAIGASVMAKEPTVLITGDLSFFYDSNGLWNKYIRSDFKIILINNNGGGIFRILPGQEDTENYETYFETVHDLNAAHLCAMYGITYYTASDEESLTGELSNFFTSSTQASLLEIKTPRLLNDKILLNYFDFLS